MVKVMEKRRLHVIVHGQVQGVYFRAWTNSQASRLGLTGFVRNLPSGRDVEIEVEGELAPLQELLELVKVGPPGARVAEITTNWSEYQGVYSKFKIGY